MFVLSAAEPTVPTGAPDNTPAHPAATDSSIHTPEHPKVATFPNSAVGLPLLSTLNFRPSTLKFQISNLLSPFRMNTYKKCACNPRRMNTYKIMGLKIPLESTLTKKGGGGWALRRPFAIFVADAAFVPPASCRHGRESLPGLSAISAKTRRPLCFAPVCAASQTLCFQLSTVGFQLRGKFRMTLTPAPDVLTMLCFVWARRVSRLLFVP